jgi:alkylhydroperoxidase family enzyme
MPSISGTTHEARVRAALESAFPTGLTAKQIQAVVSFSKLVRFRARSNNALYPRPRYEQTGTNI